MIRAPAARCDLTAMRKANRSIVSSLASTRASLRLVEQRAKRLEDPVVIMAYRGRPSRSDGPPAGRGADRTRPGCAPSRLGYRADCAASMNVSRSSRSLAESGRLLGLVLQSVGQQPVGRVTFQPGLPGHPHDRQVLVHPAPNLELAAFVPAVTIVVDAVDERRVSRSGARPLVRISFHGSLHSNPRASSTADFAPVLTRHCRNCVQPACDPSQKLRAAAGRAMGL